MKPGDMIFDQLDPKRLKVGDPGVEIGHAGPRVYPMGPMVIALVRPFVSPSVFRYLLDRSFNFSETLH